MEKRPGDLEKADPDDPLTFNGYIVRDLNTLDWLRDDM